MAMARAASGGTRCGGDETDGVGSHADASNKYWDVPSAEIDANRTANTLDIIRTNRETYYSVSSKVRGSS